METFLKWAILAGVIFWIWRWWASGVNANFNIGPGGPGYGGYGIPSNQAGYTFSGPGVLFGINPSSFAQRGAMGSVAEF